MTGIRGVAGIRNLLSIVPTEKVDDEIIADLVVAALKRNVLVNPEEIEVGVRNGIVALFGVVRVRAAREAAVKEASYTEGVVDVINNLGVAERTFSKNPWSS